jgi:hypothetical protein
MSNDASVPLRALRESLAESLLRLGMPSGAKAYAVLSTFVARLNAVPFQSSE